MRPIALAFLFSLFIPSVALAEEAADYVPADTTFVIRWQNPMQTIERAEAFMLRLGLAPPGSKKGFLVQQLRGQAPALAAVDFNRPVWAVAFGELEDPKPMFLFTLREGAPTEGLAETMQNTRIEKHDDIIAFVEGSLPPELGKKKQRTPYAFASPSIAGQSNLAIDAVGESLQKILSGSDGGQPELAELEAAVARVYAGMKGMTIGANLNEASMTMTLGSVFDAKSVYARSLAKVKNAKGSVLRGLPAGSYAIVLGGASPETSEDSLPMVKTILEAVKPALQRDPEAAVLAGQLDPLLQVLEESWGASSYSAMGLQIPRGLESAQLLGYVEGDSKKIKRGFDGLFDWLKQTMAKVAERNDQPLPIELVRSSEAKKTAGVPFDSFGLDLTGEEATAMRAEMGPYAELVDRRLQLGVLNKSTALLVWTDDGALVERAIAAAKKREAIVSEDARLRAASAALPAERYAEGYIDLGPIAGAAVRLQVPAMASTIRSALSAVPPMGYTQSKTSGTEARTDVFIPLELIEAAIGVSQLLRGG